ncbi:MAG: hypothetical protein OXG85_07730 [Chloroflexi bacterium]|nr:hypothetical protein [Chloroflexota bacterium]
MWTAFMCLGVVLIIGSVAVDLLPEAGAGFNSFQILLLVAGLILTPASFVLRRTSTRRALLTTLRRNLLASLSVTLVSLILLELLLTALGVAPQYPATVPERAYEPAPWWTCDASGCHYVAAHIHEVCDGTQHTVWPCVVNQQGFYDSQDFVYSDELESKLRVIAMGDSFTFGLSADAGKSYIEVIEADVPNSIVWNTGVSGIGTRQALASFEAFAPILKPQIAIYGFYVNDFDDNLLPINGYFVGVDEAGRPIGIRNHRVDKWGNVTKLNQATALFYHEHGVDPPSSAIERLLGLTRLGSLALNAVETLANASGLSLNARHEKRLAVTRELLTAMRDRAAALDTTLLLLLIPSKDDLRAGPGLRHRTAVKLFEELSIAYLNPIDALDVKADYAPSNDVHWNTAGHQKIGKMLSDCLRRFQSTGELSACGGVAAPQ